MKQIGKNFSVLLAVMTAVMMFFSSVSLTTETSYADETVTQGDNLDLGKTASPVELSDDNLITHVELSVPSKETKRSNDIVFVVDASDCSFNSIPKCLELLKKLAESQKKNGVSNKIGLVFFRGSAFSKIKLDELTDAMISEMENLYETQMNSSQAYEAILKKWGQEADPEYVWKGSNLDSGLQEAKQMLDQDTETPAKQKYLITISDGLTYFFNDKDNNVKTIYAEVARSGAGNCLLETFDEANGISQEGKYTVPEGFTWDGYYNKISGLIQNDGDTYVADYRKTAQKLGVDYASARTFDDSSKAKFNELGYKTIQRNAEGKYHNATSVDRSVYESCSTWNDIVNEGCNCYYIQAAIFGENSFSTFFAKALNNASGKSENIDFDKIGNEIIYAVETGTITDEIDDNFDLVNNGEDCPFIVTIKGEKLDAVKTGGQEWSFGEKIEKEDGTSQYPYVLQYQQDGDNDRGESITLQINKHIAYNERLVLGYDLKLVCQPKGSYPSVETTYQTNKSAVLDYTRTDGKTGRIEFPVPEVQYIPETMLISDPSSVTSDNPQVQKKITGDEPETESTFTFELKALPEKSTLPDGMTSMPMPENAGDQKSVLVTIQGEGTSEFGTIEFTKPGTYVYQVTERNDGAANYTYDNSVYEISYRVYVASENQLSCERTLFKDNREISEIYYRFVNKYNKPVNDNIKPPDEHNTDPAGSEDQPTIKVDKPEQYEQIGITRDAVPVNQSKVTLSRPVHTGDVAGAVLVVVVTVTAAVLVAAVLLRRKQTRRTDQEERMLK